MSHFKEQNNIFIDIFIYLLTFISGYINATSIYKFLSPVSHVTGTVTKVGIDVAKLDFKNAILTLVLLVCFFLGASLSGVLFHTKKFSLKRRYGVLLISYGLILLLLSFIRNIDRIIIYIFSFILGSQNAMFIFYKKGLIRTTHFTGYLSDAGFSFGKFLVGDREELKKTVFYLFSILIFMFGAFCGISNINLNYLYFISLMYILVGLYYFIMRIKITHQ